MSSLVPNSQQQAGDVAPKIATVSPEAAANPARQAQQRQAQQHYQRTLVETASPTRLIVLLYDGAVRFCRQAIEAMQKQDLEGQHTNLIKAQRILSELMSSLNREVGGEVAENLMRLYVHMMEQLVQANLKDEVAPVQAVQKMLMELREAWQEIDRLAMQAQSETAGTEAPPPEMPKAPVAAAPAGKAPNAAMAAKAAQARALQAAQNASAAQPSRLGDRNA